MLPSVCIAGCSRGYFHCVYGGRCLWSYRRCDGRCDCPYCTDELDCYTPPSGPNITTYQPSTLRYQIFTTTQWPWYQRSTTTQRPWYQRTTTQWSWYRTSTASPCKYWLHTDSHSGSEKKHPLWRFFLYLRGKCVDLHKIFRVCLWGIIRLPRT